MFFLCIISLFFWLPLAVQVRTSRTLFSNFGNCILTLFAHNPFSSGQFHLSKSFLTSQVLLYAVIARLVFHRILIQKLMMVKIMAIFMSRYEFRTKIMLICSNLKIKPPFYSQLTAGGSVTKHSGTISLLLMIIRCVKAIASSTTNTNSATALLPLSTSSWPTQQSPSMRRCCQSCPGSRDVSENTSQMIL